MVEFSFLILAKAFISLFIILDPFLSVLSVLMFITLTRNSTPVQKSKDAGTAVGIAALLMLLFLVGGSFLLDLAGINFDSFMIGGGIIILILGIKTVLGLGFSKAPESSIILIGTPMMSGPGSLTTLIVLSNLYGMGIAAVAAVFVLLVTWLMLLYAHYIEKFLGSRVIEVLSRIIGLIITAVAVEFIINGIKNIIIG